PSRRGFASSFQYVSMTAGQIVGLGLQIVLQRISYEAGTVQGFTAQTDCLNKGLVVQGTTIKVPYDKQVPGLPAQSGAGGGYMSPSLVSQAWNTYGDGLKGLMTWSINWDGSKGWTFGDNVKGLEQ
ncbi:hypothetical protein ABZT51_47855, partial [Streptomyces sp. NPDC005373]